MTKYYQCPECGRLEQTQDEARLFCGDVGAVLVNPDPEPEFGYERMRPVKIVPVAPVLPEGVYVEVGTFPGCGASWRPVGHTECDAIFRSADPAVILRVSTEYIFNCIERDIK